LFEAKKKKEQEEWDTAIEELHVENGKGESDLFEVKQAILAKQNILKSLDEDYENTMKEKSDMLVGYNCKVKELENNITTLKGQQDIEQKLLEQIQARHQELTSEISSMEKDKSILDKNLKASKVELNGIETDIEAEEKHYKDILKENKEKEEEENKRVAEVEKVLIEKAKDLDVREKHLNKVEKKLLSYKSQIEELSGKRLPDLNLN
jgi:chromosome segregation ATPase